jgi:hypothetical protein
VRFHAPIDPAAVRALPEEDALLALLAELRRRVERSLLPGVKADLRTAVLYHGPAPRPRSYELLAAFAYAAVGWAAAGPLVALAPALAYLLYLWLDVTRIPQSRRTKRLRNASALVFLMAAGPLVLRALDLPLLAPGALAAATAAAGLPYLYERGRIAAGFVSGGVRTCLLETGALLLAPVAAGPHVALAAFAAAYAWDRRTVFWRYAVPALIVYAGAVALAFGGGPALGLHAAAGLAAWLITRLSLFPRPFRRPAARGAVAGPAAGASASPDRRERAS